MNDVAMKADTREAPEPLLLNVEDVCRLLKIGRSRFYKSEKLGQFGPLPAKAFGRSKRYRADEVHAWIEHDMPPRRL